MMLVERIAWKNIVSLLAFSFHPHGLSEAATAAVTSIHINLMHSHGKRGVVSVPFYFSPAALLQLHLSWF